ncbi:MAG: sugar phosphorylase [Anaerolineaceae bacterium]|nr:sugar phosphorylase [Anaerolineaceae bacterium]
MELKNQKIYDGLMYLYGKDAGEKLFKQLELLIIEFKKNNKKDQNDEDRLFSHKDIVLITYGNTLLENGEKPLRTLLKFFQKYLQGYINSVHILPFSPYSSDDGFSVVDYLAVDPELGDWEDVRQFQSNDIRLMMDAVINHISSQSEWFQKFLLDDPNYKNYFISVDPGVDLSSVTRPRTLPLITAYQTKNGKKWVWTTFSADQIDLNYKNPDTFLDVIKVILNYIQNGANLIRLDAIAYLWKEIGTHCIHLPQTHAVVQLLRNILDEVASNVLLITETNVPHDENISYFGDGNNEAHLVYQFPLPPLIAHAILTGSAHYLSNWARELQLPSKSTSYFNFTASHDGIGVRPLMGILTPEEMQLLVDKTLLHGGRISSKTNSDGTSSPYELNISYFDLLNNPYTGESIEIQVKRFLISQAIPLVLAGIPGIYIHSLLGSRNNLKGVEETGINRAINRPKLDLNFLEDEFRNPTSLRSQVISGYKKLISCRITELAFHPNADQKILDFSPAIFSVLRSTADGNEIILALQNITNQKQKITISMNTFGDEEIKEFKDVLTQRTFSPHLEITIQMTPYEIIWLKPHY